MENEAEDARKRIKTGKPTHRTRFTGSPRKLKGRARGTWVQVGANRWKWVKNGR